MGHYTYIPERKKEYNKRYREKLKAKGIIINNRYAKSIKKWKENNREKILEYHRNYNKLYIRGIKRRGIKDKELRKLNLKKCQICNYKEYTEILIVHHIQHRAKGGTGEISNLQVLCPNCHAIIHLKERKVAPKKEIKVIIQAFTHKSKPFTAILRA